MNNDLEPQIVDVGETTTAVISGTVPMSGLAEFFDESFQVLGEILAKQGVTPTGAAFAFYHGIPGESATLEVGFPTAGEIEPEGSAAAGKLPGGQVARLIHAGSFDGLGDVWQRLGSWIDQQGLTPSNDYWEVYLTEPSPEMDPADLRTELNWPVS